MTKRQGPLFRPAGSLAVDGDPIRLTPEEASWNWCGMMVADLPPGDSRHFELGEDEAAVVPLQGSCQVEVGSTRFRWQGRPDVFSALTDLCFAPKGSVITIS